MLLHVNLHEVHVWCPCRKNTLLYAEWMVTSCPETISMLCDPKLQFMTPNLVSWSVLCHGGVSVEPSCLLCGKGLNLFQGL